MLKNDSRSKKLQNLVDACNLNLLPLNATHTVPNCRPSLLDLILISSPTYVVKHGQCAADAFSNHDLLYLSYRLRLPKLKHRILMQRSFGGMDLDRLRNDAANIDWNAILKAHTVEEKVSVFSNFIINLYDVHAPIKPVKIKHLPAPWLTDELRVLLHKKNKSKTQYKMKPSDVNREKYKIIRNKCNTACRDAQRRHIHTSIENGDPAKVWKFLKTLGVGSKDSSCLSKDINLESLNQHFTSASFSLNNNIKTKTLSYLSSLPPSNFPSFHFKSFSVSEVEKIILSITSNSVGVDGISRNMIVPILDIVTPIITHILNASITSSVFPKMWKKANVIPIPKTNSPKSSSDYRPISILPFLSKILERLVQQQLSSFLNKNSLLNPFQSGFRPGHSTTTALLKITDDIRWGMDNKMLTVLVLLDFSNAFNTVDFDLLLAMLQSINLSPNVLEWFQSYLAGRQQRVLVDNSFSTWRNVTAGVPQGGVLSPLLFAMFINFLTPHLTSLYHLYADDLQIYAQSSLDELNSAINSINDNLNKDEE
ncbi:unnamed protein product [Colias eurytheme]|nr:unnamed protein product [Colias eurytheme]